MHNIILSDTAIALKAAAGDERCVGMMVSIECKTYSAALHLPDAYGNPGKPYRNESNVLGIPLADGTLPRIVADANKESEVAAALTMINHEAGGGVIAEAPVRRAPGNL